METLSLGPQRGKKSFIPAAGSERGPCPEARQLSTCPPAQEKAHRKLLVSYSPACVAYLHNGPVWPGMKKTYMNSVLQPPFGMWHFGAPDTPHFCDSLVVVKQEQPLPTAAPAILERQRAFSTWGEKHHRNPRCCSGQGEAGAQAPSSPSLLCNWPNTTQCPLHKDPSLTCVLLFQLAILRLLACQ